MDELLRDFLTETHENLDVVDVELVRFEQDPNNADILGNIFRLVHTIKGTCGFLGLPKLEALTHAAEGMIDRFRRGMPVTGEAVTLILATIDRIKARLDELERTQQEQSDGDEPLIEKLRQMAGAMESGHAPSRRAAPSEPTPAAPAPSPPADATPASQTSAEPDNVQALHKERDENRVAHQSIRVNVDTLDHLMTMVSELVLTRNQLLEIVRRHQDSEFKGPLQRLSNVTAELQDGVMKTRMQPIGNAWQKLPRVVRDLSKELGKSIEIEMVGADTELDRQVLELIKDPLTHMVRNSADHGIETPAERRAAGKPPQGTLRLSAHHEAGHIIIVLSDDGRGLDTAKIKARLTASGRIPVADVERMTEVQIHKHIFLPGISTAETVTSVSGRGVGMDVVRSNIDQIGGTIDVKSVVGRGVSFIIKIPLTLAIVSALIVEAGGERFAIPQLAVVELVRTHANSEHRIERIRDAAVLRLRNALLPLARLSTLLGLDVGEPADDDGKGFVVVMQVGSQTFGVIVDAVFQTEEIVVKPMSSKLRHIAMLSGNTILGDGSVITILDPNGVAQALGPITVGDVMFESQAVDQTTNVSDGTDAVLLLRAGSPQPRAVPLALVTRLEEIDGATIEVSNGRHVVQYRGQLMPIVPANEEVEIRRSGGQPTLVFADAGRVMGFAVDAIVDIVNGRLDIELGSERPGILGTAVIKGQATEIIDIGYYLPLAFDDWMTWRPRQDGARRWSVLLVDDSPFFRSMLAPVLRAAGCDVTTAASASAALTCFGEDRKFDVVVTDLDMPEIDGFALADQLRRDPRTMALPVIGLSSTFSADVAERAHAVGLRDCVAKFDRPGLIAALQEQFVGAQQAA